MKQSFFSICVLALCLMAAPSFAQKKNEEKEWKKKQKDMDPLAFKAMYEEYQQLKSDAASKERELSTLRKQLTTKEADISAKDVEINELRSQIQKAEADKGANDAQASQNLIANGDDYTKGIVFKVQVGAFTKKTYSEKIDGSFWEEDEDGVKKYTIGRFRDYQEATRFKNYLRAIGVSDAWIVAYEDNQRKDIKNILDNAGIPSTDDK